MSSTTKKSHGHGHSGPPEPASKASVAAGHELTDIQVGPLVWSLVIIFALLIFSFILIFGLLAVAGNGITDVGHQLDPTAIQAQLPPGPLLEQNPRQHTDAILAEQLEQLNGFGWVNERAGRAHIPIERAKEVLLEQGVDVFNQ
jgi:hypothetical protein